MKRWKKIIMWIARMVGGLVRTLGGLAMTKGTRTYDRRGAWKDRVRGAWKDWARGAWMTVRGP